MLRVLLARVAAGLALGALAGGCSNDDRAVEELGAVQEAAKLGGAGAGGAADAGGAPGLGGAGGAPAPDCVVDADCLGEGECLFCNSGSCEPRAASEGFVCRAASAGGCDAAEVCDGGRDCPPDSYQPAGTVCRPAADGMLCDEAETCDGLTDVCPADENKPVGTVCRPKAGDCDVEEVCLGGAECPAIDVKAGPQTLCRAAAGVCDGPEFCNGSDDDCPADLKLPSTEVCRPAHPALDCDEAETCDGGNDCPADIGKPDSVVCREAAGVCDVAETCRGLAEACPADVFRPTSVVCRPSANVCDPAETCSGSSAHCGPDDKLDGVPCSDPADKCQENMQCEAGICVGGTPKVCPAGDVQCQTPTCNKATGACGLSNLPSTTTCDDAIDCTTEDHCSAGRCVGTPDHTRCRKPQHGCATFTCDPNTDPGVYPDFCRMTPLSAGTQCRGPGGPCGKAEQCDGQNQDCPADVHEDASKICQAASCGGGTAIPQINCSGTSASCPIVPTTDCDGYACDGLTCRDSCAGDDDCLVTHYCAPSGSCELRVGAGEPCTSDEQCQSGSKCADGVCCNTACTGQCEACNVEGSVGTCSAVTGAPRGDRPACDGDGSACHGVCNGALRSACTFPSTQTPCRDAACEAGVAVEQAFCDGEGSCATTAPVDCAPFSCGPSACRGDCATDAQCSGDAYCKANKCVERERVGIACTRDAQCASGFCTDGVCCDARCDGQCEACGRSGRCEAVRGQPVGGRAACAGEAGETCAGSCDGQNRQQCSYPGAAVVCREASCEAGRATVAAHCRGDGACPAPRSVSCRNGCEGTLCAGDGCLVDSDCQEGEHCLAGQCTPPAENGAACASAAECGSGFCVDGVCCESACDGQCEACDGPNGLGVCAPVRGAPRGNRPSCTSDGSPCGGACDGKNADGCSYPSGTVCSPGGCQDGQEGGEGVAIVESICNGSGRCPTPRQQSCGAAGCDAADKLCAGDCADGSPCPSGQYCSAGVCVSREATGTACQSDQQCASGFCVDGYCCSSACDDRCAACDVPGSLGQCSPTAGPTRGGRPGCRGGGVCGAQCDGESVTDCAFPGAETSCSEPYCQQGVQTAASACDGAGQCRPGERTECSSLACAGDECSDECQVDADCTRALQCREGRCVEPYLIDAVDEGTCGCRAPGAAPGAHRGWLVLAGLALLAARRRRPRTMQGLQ